MADLTTFIYQTEICPEIESPDCDGAYTRGCSGGLDANGCQVANYCIPQTVTSLEIPNKICVNHCPVTCGETEVFCPGAVIEGCPLPGYCAVECPAVCPPITGVECGADEMMCAGGVDDNGCEMPGTCIPIKSGDCFNKCPVMCDYAAGQIACSGGDYLIYNTDIRCPMGDYCTEPYDDCPAMCGANCNWIDGEKTCDLGIDDNGCWLGNYCAAECPSQA